jgi:quercetin dioxygenase-like cupin family protein
MAFVMVREDLINNNAFRRVLYTGEQQQYVAMALRPGENIGLEQHENATQTVIAVDGKGEAIVADETEPLDAGKAVLIEPGTFHDVTADDNSWLRLLVIYSPPLHPIGEIQYRKPELTPAEEKLARLMRETSVGDDSVSGETRVNDEED